MPTFVLNLFLEINCSQLMDLPVNSVKQMLLYFSYFDKYFKYHVLATREIT